VSGSVPLGKSCVGLVLVGFGFSIPLVTPGSGG